MFARPELFWFFLGLVLLLAELVIPGFFIFFFGVGAWVTAIVCLLWDPGVNLQIILFGLVSVISLIALRRLLQERFFYHDSKKSDEVEDEFTGKEAVASTDFGVGITGKVFFKGTTWMSESKSEIKEGQRVVIKRKENFKLIVEPKN
ncbi:MAG TPA: NfeD family protein [Bacteroidales bacterium]|jgi:membrane protein implicated in regulation of membrane protease activity|nr:NfeD family protein [Bacteroidales bacterium]